MTTCDPEICQLIFEMSEKKKNKRLPITVRELLENPQDFNFSLFDDADDEGYGYYESSDESDIEDEDENDSIGSTSDAGLDESDSSSDESVLEDSHDSNSDDNMNSDVSEMEIGLSSSSEN